MIERTDYLEQLKRFKDKDLIKVVTGIIGHTFQWVEYKKIQYIEYDQNIIMKRMKFTDATIHILASSTESQLNLPYMKDEYGEQLRRKVPPGTRS